MRSCISLASLIGLFRRLIPFDYDCLFHPSVAEFVNKKAASFGYCPGYLTSTAYISYSAAVFRKCRPTFTCMVFVGPPGTGKSQALKEGALQPMHDVLTERDMQNCISAKCTSSALVKTVAEHSKAFIVLPEIFDVLNKLLKSDKENATGDVQILCQLFSGERSSFRFASERAAQYSFFHIGIHPITLRCTTALPHGLGPWLTGPLFLKAARQVVRRDESLACDVRRPQ